MRFKMSKLIIKSVFLVHLVEAAMVNVKAYLYIWQYKIIKINVAAIT